MKKKFLTLGIILLAGLLMPTTLVGQTTDTNKATQDVTLSISTSALLAIKTGSSISMALGGATQAGAPVQSQAIDQTSRLRISNLVEGTTQRKITASIDKDFSSTNTQLKVQLLAPNTNFHNGYGTLTGSDQILTTTSISLATDIVTCWSGVTDDDGYKINYTFEHITEAGGYSNPGKIVVTYTLLDE